MVAMMLPYKMAFLHAKGTKAENHAYCTKEETRIEGPWYVKSTAADYKGKNGNQGKRTDMDDFAKLAFEHDGNIRELANIMPGHALRFNRHAQQLIADVRREAAVAAEEEHWIRQAQLADNGQDIDGQQQRNLVLLFGPTAVGKTTEVKMQAIGRDRKKLYTKSAANKWWDGYTDQKAVLIDEMKGKSFCSIEEFNAMTNIGTHLVETKGGHAVLVAEDMYFTTNTHPTDWWGEGDRRIGWDDARYRAVARRFAKVMWWNDAKELVVLKNPGEQRDTQEWEDARVAWNQFWRWRDRPVQEGDNGAYEYFTL